jgi:hypothetical protein
MGPGHVEVGVFIVLPQKPSGEWHRIRRPFGVVRLSLHQGDDIIVAIVVYCDLLRWRLGCNTEHTDGMNYFEIKDCFNRGVDANNYFVRYQIVDY